MIHFTGIHHHSILVADINVSTYFYSTILGLSIDKARPQKLPFRGAWYVVGAQAIHALELPNPDENSERPKHGGRDRHVALSCDSVQDVITQLKKYKVPYTQSKSGRAAVFFRDPDQNAIEVME